MTVRSLRTHKKASTDIMSAVEFPIDIDFDFERSLWLSEGDPLTNLTWFSVGIDSQSHLHFITFILGIPNPVDYPAMNDILTICGFSINNAKIRYCAESLNRQAWDPKHNDKYHVKCLYILAC